MVLNSPVVMTKINFQSLVNIFDISDVVREFHDCHGQTGVNTFIEKNVTG